MFGMRHRERHGEGHCAGMRHGRGRWRGGRGWGGKHGMGGDDFMRAGRMLAQGDLRLIALALIAEQPRHGYDIIKQLEVNAGIIFKLMPGFGLQLGYAHQHLYSNFPGAPYSRDVVTVSGNTKF
jgi:hypothetical protein